MRVFARGARRPRSSPGRRSARPRPPPPDASSSSASTAWTRTSSRRCSASGELPSLADLQKRGGYSPLTPTVPAQTPVSWATFSTGLDPGGHEIFDFLKRDPANRIPTFAVAEEIEVPFLFGQEQSRGFAAAARSCCSASRRSSSRAAPAPRRGALLVLAVGAAPAALSSAARAWLPADAARGSATTGAGPVFWSEAGRAARRPSSGCR